MPHVVVAKRPVLCAARRLLSPCGFSCPCLSVAQTQKTALTVSAGRQTAGHAGPGRWEGVSARPSLEERSLGGRLAGLRGGILAVGRVLGTRCSAGRRGFSGWRSRRVLASDGGISSGVVSGGGRRLGGRCRFRRLFAGRLVLDSRFDLGDRLIGGLRLGFWFCWRAGLGHRFSLGCRALVLVSSRLFGCLDGACGLVLRGCIARQARAVLRIGGTSCINRTCCTSRVSAVLRGGFFMDLRIIFGRCILGCLVIGAGDGARVAFLDLGDLGFPLLHRGLAALGLEEQRIGFLAVRLLPQRLDFLDGLLQRCGLRRLAQPAGLFLGHAARNFLLVRHDGHTGLRARHQRFVQLVADGYAVNGHEFAVDLFAIKPTQRRGVVHLKSKCKHRFTTQNQESSPNNCAHYARWDIPKQQFAAPQRTPQQSMRSHSWA
nr:MAG TPA: hypothetical protein [Caudoviricetes sp.]